MKEKLIKHGHSYALVLDEKLVAFAHPKDFRSGVEIGKLSLKNCQAIERGYDLDELVGEYCTHEPKNAKELRDVNLVKMGFRDGFQKALETLGNKKFSEEDILRSAIHCWNIASRPEYGATYNINEIVENYIQSLQQTEWDVLVEMECLTSGSFQIIDWSKNPPKTTGEVPLPCVEERIKLDADGCLILKRV